LNTPEPLGVVIAIEIAEEALAIEIAIAEVEVVEAAKVLLMVFIVLFSFLNKRLLLIFTISQNTKQVNN